MNKFYVCLVLCICFTQMSFARSFIWTGPLNGKWSNPLNWRANGVSGAAVPGVQDSVLFAQYMDGGMATYAIELDVSPAVAVMRVDYTSSLKLFTAIPVTFTVTSLLSLQGDLTDSTVEDVPFNFILDHATGYLANPSPEAHWYFTGRVPVSSGNGAFFTARAGAPVTVSKGISLVYRTNSGSVAIKDSARLVFEAGSHFVVDHKRNIEIPPATWAAQQSPTFGPIVPAAELVISGTFQTLRHSGVPGYGTLLVSLPDLESDADLGLPNGTVIKGYFSIRNTNNHVLSLLNAASPSDSVVVVVNGDDFYGRGFIMEGDSTRIAMAHAGALTAATNFHFTIPSFSQSGGNFSLQDADTYSGESRLTTTGNVTETGGTFITGSTATRARFVVELNGPTYVTRPYGILFNTQVISMSSGSIDNGRGTVTLRAAQTSFLYTAPSSAALIYSPVGINVNSPLTVGRLELAGGPLFTSASSLLTVANPSPDAVRITSSNSYVNGPVRRATNAAQAYMFPTGKGTQLLFNLDTCVVIPATARASLYEAEYFANRYAGTAVAAPLRGVDSTRYWNIARISGADAQVRLVLNKAVPGATAQDYLAVAQYNGNQWTNVQEGVLQRGNSVSGPVTSGVLSVFSAFTWGYGFSANTPLPVRLLSFSGAAEGSGIRLQWKVAEAVSGFDVLRSRDGVLFSRIAAVQGSGLQRDFTYLDSLPDPGASFYRLRSIGMDGTTGLSAIISINRGQQPAYTLTLTPTLVRSRAIMHIQMTDNGLLHFAITDINGHNWKNGTIPVKAGSNAAEIDLSDLPAGLYQLRGYGNGTEVRMVRFVKQ